MFKGLFGKVLDTNQKEIARLQKLVEQVNSLESKYQKLKKTDFAKQTQVLRKQLAKGKKLDDLLPDAFALVREATVRALGMRHFDVQIMAAIALFDGKVVEQKTGEGKTISAVPALYLRSLEGKGVHLVTVNDYLARRDAGWNAPIFDLLGMSVGVIIQEGKSYVYDKNFTDSSHGDERLAHLKPSERKDAYAADITYGTNNEFGFDYLRDNMVQSLDQMVQRGHYYSIVDEVDSVLVDEARTPLIISAPDSEPTSKYVEFAKLASQLKIEEDYEIDEKTKGANLTETGISRVEKLLGVTNLYEKDFDSIHYIENALKAQALYLIDREYVIKENKVIIVDESTGRLMYGRRWSDGLHQAVEAKEGVEIQQESKTMATISFQNYFRLYEHLAGMTGTAATEAEEFKKIYGLDVVVVPTNKPIIREDIQDSIYKTLDSKYTKIVDEIKERRANGQPVLVGTVSIEKNEIVGQYLAKAKVPHNILNAKNHEKEALIIAQAGKPGQVTIATNMAGRGVDIVLGGAMPDKPDGITEAKWKASPAYKKWRADHDTVIAAGGLHVVGTERHESRRIDNQLRGRSGRQGDPGSTKFYLSLEDDLMRIFGGEQIGGLMNRLNVPDDQPIENKLVSRAIEQAQIKVEGFHFDNRKRVVEYDDVANQQRDIVYKLRNKILTSKSLKEDIEQKLHEQVRLIVLSAKVSGELESDKVVSGLLEIVPLDDTSRDGLFKTLASMPKDAQVEELLSKVISDIYASHEKRVGADTMRQVERFAYLGALDHEWIDHIDTIDGLREGIQLRSYAQRDPLTEFKQEAYSLFEGLLGRVDSQLARRIFRVGVRQAPEIPLASARTNIDTSDLTGLAGNADTTSRVGARAFNQAASGGLDTTAQETKKLGRNDPCWCGSGKKWKKCHYPKRG